MAQLLFSQVLQQVLDLSVPFREELEVLFVKLLLKPLEQIDKRLMSGPNALAQSQAAPKTDKMQQISTNQSSIGEVSFLSDDEDNGADENRAAADARSTAQSAMSYEQQD